MLLQHHRTPTDPVGADAHSDTITKPFRALWPADLPPLEDGVEGVID